jgi:beta-barrel assembly-enhancing protease
MRDDFIKRRELLIGVLGLSVASFPAHAQFGDIINRLNGGSGGGTDVGKVIGGFGSIFDAIKLGEADEIRMGSELYPRIIDQAGGTYKNQRSQSALQHFAAPLLATSKRPALQWEITLLDDSSVNAWALPGGKIAINKGLLRYARDENELAAVICHEMGHAELSHGLAEMRQQKFTQGFSEIGKQAIAQSRRDGSGALGAEFFNQVQGPLFKMISSGYSREHEGEADQHILSVFGRTGYEPSKAANFFRTLLDITPEGTQQTTSLYSTHPATRERISAIDSAARTMPPPPPRSEVSSDFSGLKKTFPTRL